MPKYVIYARKSSESEDRQVLSIDSQVRELRSIADRQGVPVAEVLSESRSAKAPGRPIFTTLMRRVKRGEIAGILCWKMDRLARNHFDTGLLLQALADGNLEAVVTSDRRYTRDGNDRFMGNFELGMATKYIDDLRANVRRGNRAKFAQGWINHIPPLGYSLDPATKTVVKDPKRFDLVRRMWDMLLENARPADILKTANEEWGFRTRRFKRTGGRPLGRTTLYSIFSNPFYMGVIRLRSGETYAGAHEAMVTREEFDRAQELLGRPGRPRPQRHSFALTGLIRCGTCDAMVTGEEHVKPSGRRYVYYRCPHRKRHVVCRERAIPEPEMERQLEEHLRRLTIPDPVLKQIRRAVESRIERGWDREKAQEMIQRSVEKNRRESENLLSLRLRDLIDDHTFRGRKVRLEQDRMQLEQKRRALEKPQEDFSRLTTLTFEFLARAAEHFRAGGRVQKRTVLETIGSNFTLADQKVHFSLRKPFSMAAARSRRTDWSTCANDVRTWLEDRTEYFKLPNLREIALIDTKP